jgi:hypothetical protein
MREEYPNFATFMSNFRTEFGDLVEPAIIIVKADAPPSYRTVEAVAGFRDTAAITAVSRAWALAIRYGTTRSTLYANWFSIYPWMLDKNFDDVITRTMAVLAIHDVKRLKPQSSAAVSPQWLEPQNIDFTLSQELLKRWTKRYADDTPDKPDTALFRSLNMAHYAALMPAGADVTMYDIGRTVALWVSAFEILAHPGDDTKNGFIQVYDLLQKVTWNLTKCAEETHQCYGFKYEKKPRNLACWVYGELNAARNDFLHGVPILEDRLTVKISGQSLFRYCALLYRMPLVAFLNLEWTIPPPDVSDVEAFVKWQSDRQDFGSYQRDIEAALATILVPYSEQKPHLQHH